MKKLILLAALTACGCAYAQNWVVLSDNKNSPDASNGRILNQIDVASIYERDGYRKVWTMTSNFPPIKYPLEKTLLLGSTVTLNMIDCKKQTFSFLVLSFFPLPYGQGTTSDTSTTNFTDAMKQMSLAPPKSFARLMIEVACAYPLK